MDTEKLESELKRAQQFTTISNGTLLTCCRESKAFSNIRNHFMHLDNLRGAWFCYLIDNVKSDNPVHFDTWMDAWNSFEAYARTTAINEYEKLLVKKFEGKLIRTIKPTKNHDGYTVYDSIMGKSKLFNNGEIRTHRRKNDDNTDLVFCSMFLFSQRR